MLNFVHGVSWPLEHSCVWTFAL